MKCRYGWWRVGPLVAALALVLSTGKPLQAAEEVVPTSACPDAGPSPSLTCDKEILLSFRNATEPGHLRTSNGWLLFDSWHPDAPLSDFEGVTVGGGAALGH